MRREGAATDKVTLINPNNPNNPNTDAHGQRS